MASQKKEEDIQCEYAYEKDKEMPQREPTIFDGEYSDGDSDNNSSELRVKSIATRNEKSKSSKKKRKSKYDEDHYALPDSDEESELRSLKLRLEAKEAKLLLNNRKLRTWKIATFVSIFVMVISVAGIAYLTVEKTNSKGIRIFTIL